MKTRPTAAISRQKSQISLGETGISEIFTLSPPNWRSDDKQEKEAEKDYF